MFFCHWSIATNEVDVFSATILNINELEFDLAGFSIARNVNNLQFVIPDTGVVRFRINLVNEMIVSQTAVTLLAGNNILMGASAGLGYIEMGALTTPLTPADGFGRYYLKEVATVTHAFFIGDDGTEFDLTTGAEVFTWTADHDTGGFSLLFTDDASPPAGTIRSIQGQNTDEIHMNVPAAGKFDFNVNDIAEMVIDAADLTLATNDLNLTAGALTFAGNPLTQRVDYDSNGMIFEASNLDDFTWLINNTEEMSLSDIALTFVNTAKNLIMIGAGAVGFIQMAEITDPAAGTNSGKYYVKDVGGISRPFFIGDGLPATDLSTGTEVTTWTADHDTGGFSLTFTDDATPPAGTVTAIYAEAGELNFNVASTNSHQWRINDALEMLLDLEALDIGTKAIIFGLDAVDPGNSIPHLNWDAGNMQFNVPTGDGYIWRIEGSSQMLLNATTLDIQAKILNFTTDGHSITPSATALTINAGVASDTVVLSLAGVSKLTVDGAGGFLTLGTSMDLNLGANSIRFNAANESISIQGGDMIFDVPTTDHFSFDIAAIPEMTLDASELDLFQNQIIFSTDGHTITPSATALTINASVATDTIDLQTGAVSRLIMDSTSIRASVPIVLNLNSLQFNDVNTTITQVGTDLEYDVVSGGVHDFRIDNVVEATLTGSIMNLPTATFQEGGVDISPIGIHDQYMGAGNFDEVTASAIDVRTVDAGVDRKVLRFMSFVNGADQFATAMFQLPRNYNNGTITVIIHWTSQVEASGTVEWDISAFAHGDGVSFATSVFPAAITVTDTQINVDEEQLTPRSAAITIGGTPAEEKMIVIKVARTGSTDTFTQPAQLLGMSINVEIDGATAV